MPDRCHQLDDEELVRLALGADEEARRELWSRCKRRGEVKAAVMVALAGLSDGRKVARGERTCAGVRKHGGGKRGDCLRTAKSAVGAPTGLRCTCAPQH